MDISAALAPTSDQLDAVELVSPRTFTIDTGSKLGTREGKTVAEIRLVDFPRWYRPSKGMLDVLAKIWGTNGKAWVGRSLTLYCDPEVTFGKEKPGGVRISHMSGIDKPTTVTIRARGAGKVQPWTVQPLTAPAQVAPGPDLAALASAFKIAGITDKTQMLTYCNQLIGRTITTATELTAPEVTQVMDALKADTLEGETNG